MIAATEILQDTVYAEYLHNERQKLQQRAVRTAVFHPDIEDYIRMPWINDWENNNIDTEAEAMAAEIAAHNFRNTSVSHVVGIGNSGLSFAAAVHKCIPDTQLNFVLKAGLEDNVVESGIPVQAYSYSKRKDQTFYVPVLPDGCNILLADDVLAKANVGREVLKCLKQNGCNVVGMAVYFDKMFQGGVARIEQELEVPVFSVIRIAGIDGAGENRRIRILDN